MNKRMFIGPIFIILLATLIAACSCKTVKAPAVTISNVFLIPEPAEPVITSGSVSSSSKSADQGPQVPGATSILERSEDQATMSLQTSDLEPGIYTVWWVICPPNARQEKMALAVGREVGRDGLGDFEATLEKDDLTLKGDLRDAKVELIVRYHGPPIEGRIDDQKSSKDGGCDIDPDPCQNVQIAVHREVNIGQEQ